MFSGPFAAFVATGAAAKAGVPGAAATTSATPSGRKNRRVPVAHPMSNRLFVRNGTGEVNVKYEVNLLRAA
jgi:hypothetical protein